MVNPIIGEFPKIAGLCGAIERLGMGEREQRRPGQRPVNAVIPRYEQRTDNVIVRVEPEFLAEQSSPKDSRFIWAYTVEIDNQSGRDLTVTDRFWHIADSAGKVQEVRAAGVVGETPMVKSGETFRYTSGAPLTAPSGMMRGAYTCLLYTSPSPRDKRQSRMPSSA